MELPYLKHKSFQQKNRYSIFSTYNFNEIYDQIETNKSNWNFIEIQKEIITALESIFSDLLNQASNSRESLFLEELLFFSKKILVNDLIFFETKKNKVNSITSKELDELKSKGHIDIELDSRVVDKILNLVSSDIDHFRKNVKLGKTKRSDLQINSGYKIFKVCKLLNSALKKSLALDTLSSYMNNKYEVSGCSIELSHQDATWWKSEYYENKPRTSYFHFDESLNNPKAIVYLSDVNRKKGCLSVCENIENFIDISPLQKIIGRAIPYIGKSKSSKLLNEYDHIYHQTFGSKAFRSDFSKLPVELMFNSHFGWDIIKGSSLEKTILENEKLFLGKKGATKIFDGGRLLHRGGLVQEGERIAIQVVFSKKQSFKLIRKIIRKIIRK